MAQAVVQKQQTVVPKFVIEEGGPYKFPLLKYNKEKRTFDLVEMVEEPMTFIVKCPRGHSIRVRNREELEKVVGDPEQVELVDMETSDVHGVINQPIKSGKKEK